MMNQSKYYQESGEVNPLNIVFGTILLLVLTLILGYVYALLVYYIPFIYVNLIITIGLGIGLAMSNRIVWRFIKNRSSKGRLILAVVSVLFVTYFQWTAFLDSLVFGRFPMPLEYLELATWIFRPAEFFGLIGQVYENGTWGIGFMGGTISGFVLGVVWFVEIGLTALPTVSAMLDYQSPPFSENLQKWYPKFTLNRDFESMASKNMVEEKLDTGVLEMLKDLGEGPAMKHSKMHVYYLEGEANQYLSIDRIFVEGGDDPKTNVTPLLQNYRIDPTTAKAILAEFRHKKDTFGNF